jgi:parvulin-like peptidyl-prolyl isomerase
VKERIAATIGIGLALAIVGILAVGWWSDVTAKPAAAAIVGGTAIPKSFYQKDLASEQQNAQTTISQYTSLVARDAASKSASVRAQGTAINSYVSQLQSQEGNLPQTVFQQLIDNIVMAQKGPSVGLQVGGPIENNYLHNQIYNVYNGPLKFAQTAASYGLSVDQFKTVVLASSRAQRMEKLLSKHAAKFQLEADVRHILISIPTAAQKATMTAKKYASTVAKDKVLAAKVLHELRTGGSWKKLAKKYSGDTGSAAKGGDLGLSATSSYVPPFRHAANTLPVHSIAIVRSVYGFHVMEVLSRKHVKFTSAQIQQNQATALQTWLTKQESVKGYVIKKINPVTSPLGSSGLSGLGNLPTTSTGTQPTAPVTTPHSGSKKSGSGKKPKK